MTTRDEIRAGERALRDVPHHACDRGVIVILPPDHREYLLTGDDLCALGRYAAEGAAIAVGYWLDDLRISRDPIPEEDES